LGEKGMFGKLRNSEWAALKGRCEPQKLGLQEFKKKGTIVLH